MNECVACKKTTQITQVHRVKSLRRYINIVYTNAFTYKAKTHNLYCAEVYTQSLTNIKQNYKQTNKFDVANLSKGRPEAALSFNAN